ncbi:MAG TPA: YebC/PmpR family DNA-binding transcriptional regulator [Candidatus Acidoferrales bacterium]|nr:YebC/PmpR family DNA-binding transcriptional regulator [Candidatus Acidoferrales bacterium]
MSGHSKWHSIKHKKAAIDAKRGKLFSKLIKEITVAARIGGGDLGGNPRLRSAVQTARSNSLPLDNIERAIKKGTGELEGVNYEEVVYEGYGPGGVAVMVNVLTDNRNRSVSEIRRLFEKHGGNFGATGCVAWMFKKRGVIGVDKSAATEEKLLELALEAGADDVSEAGDAFEIVTAPEAFEAVKTALEDAGIKPSHADLMMVPENVVRVTGKDAEHIVRLLEAIDDHDDVQSVASNADFAPEELERLSA